MQAKLDEPELTYMQDGQGNVCVCVCVHIDISQLWTIEQIRACWLTEGKTNDELRLVKSFFSSENDSI